MNKKLNYDLTIESTKEQVADFFKENYGLSEKIINNILKEDISGEVLNKLKDEDYKLLKIKTGPKKNIQNYLMQNKNKFFQKPIQKNIDIFSSNEEIKKFFSNYLNFKKEINIDAKQLFNLTNDDMKEIGLNLGQRIKLLYYIENIEKQNEIKIDINERSSKEEVASFLKNELNFSDNSIDELELDGENIFANLEIKEIEESQDFEVLTQEEKEKLINLIRKIRQGNKNNNFKKEDKIKLNFKNNNLNEELIKNNKDENINKLGEDGKVKDLNSIKQSNKTNLSRNHQAMNNSLSKNKDIPIEKENEFELKRNKIIINKYEEINKKIEDNPIINNLNKGNKILNEKNRENKNGIKLKIENKLFPNKNSKIFEEEKKEDEKQNDKLKKLFDNSKHEKELDNKQINKKEFNDKKIVKLKGKEETDINIKKESKNKFYEIKPLKKCSDGNIFFFFGINEKDFELSSLEVYDYKSKFRKFVSSLFNKSNNNYYKYRFIDEKNVIKNNYKIKYLLIQIPLENKINNEILIQFKIDNNTLNPIILEINDNYYDNKNNNYFLIDNLNYAGNREFFKLDINDIIIFYFKYFFSNEKNKDERLQESLIKIIKNKISKFKNYKLKLSYIDILDFFKYCFHFKSPPTNIKCIELLPSEKEDNIPLNDEYKGIIKYKVNEDEQSAFFKLLIKIFASKYKEFLKELYESKDYKIYIQKNIIELIKENKLKDDELKELKLDFLLKETIIFSVCKTIKEINKIIESSSIGFVNCLTFIINNYNSFKSYTKKRKQINEYIEIPKIKKEDDLEEIYGPIKNLFELDEKHNIEIINYEKILEQILIIYFGEPLEEYLKLKKIVEIFKSKEQFYYKINKFYTNIHNKGLRLIEKKEMDLNRIIKFIQKDDIFYYDPEYLIAKERDPKIFKDIQITDNDENYKENIKKLKENRILSNFKNSKNENEFYNIFLKQVKRLKDFKFIFELFSIEDINKKFAYLIKKKIEIEDNRIIYSLLDEKEEDFDDLFEIMKNILIIENKYNIGLTDVELNDHFTPKFYFFLLKNKEDDEVIKIVNKLQKSILNYFTEQIKRKNGNEESIISQLLISPNKEFTLKLLNEMDIMDEYDDFYQKGENRNYKIFKLFFEKCKDLINDKNLSEGKYLKESILLKNKILKDLEERNLIFNVINNLIDNDNAFYEKILVIVDGDENYGKKIYNKIEEDLKNCNNKLEKIEIIEKYYIAFLPIEKKEIIEIIDVKLKKLRNKNLNEIVSIPENKIIENNQFKFEESIKESEKIKYNDSLFFISIYNENNDKYKYEKTEQQILDDSINEYRNCFTKIIKLKETNEPFFEINHTEIIMKEVSNLKDNKFDEEIKFIEKEFQDLNKSDYIKNNLLDDLINYSNKEKVEKLSQFIIYFIESYCKIFEIQETEFIQKLKTVYNKLTLKNVSSEDIKEGIKELSNLNYNIKEETTLTKFYEIFYGKEDSINFLQKIKKKNFEIRNLNEFIDENENSQLQSTDIDNLLDIYTFFNNLIDNKEIKTDEDFHNIFRSNFESNNNIIIKMKGYLSTYGEIEQLFNLYDQNPEMTIQKVYNLIKNSNVKIFLKDDSYIYEIKYLNQKNQEAISSIKEIEELKNKIYISSTNTNLIKEEGKKDITKKFKDLIDNLEILTRTLNSLIQSGYPNIVNLSLSIEDSCAFMENDKNMTIKKIIEEYNKKNKEHKKSIKKGYKEFPLLRLFYGEQFIKIYEKIKNNNVDISNLLFNLIKNFNINFEYNNDAEFLVNINNYLKELFKSNQVDINEKIYIKNKVNNPYLKPDLYRKMKTNNYSKLFKNILNLYINLTGNSPVLNNILICNENTNIEQVNSFLYRAILCDEPTLFLITNLECLELSVTQKVFKKLQNLYTNKNKDINSYLVLIYEKNNSGLSRDIEKLIPEKNILRDDLFQPKETKYLFEEIELYSSKFTGYGKTTEIKYKIEEKNGKYFYLPIGGSFTPNYIINNLENLNLNIENGKEIYLHIDLSETDNENVMNELLFKLLILKYYDSKEKIFYLGYDVNIIIEIPTGFVNFEKNFEILTIFKKTYIEELLPLRLEKGKKRITEGFSPISLVALTLKLYDKGDIRKLSLNLDNDNENNTAINITSNEIVYIPDPKYNKHFYVKDNIIMTIKECDEIIKKYLAQNHFDAHHINYYQKMNFIKILSSQFTKFYQNAYFNNEDRIDEVIENARETTITNLISLTKIFTCSLFNEILFNENNKYKDIDDIYEKLEKSQKDPFSFEKIKPSLIFFNLDGQSISIITDNENKNGDEYKKLKNYWNSQNANQYIKEELKDYKKMNHEQFIDEIRIIFNLDSLGNEGIKNLCKKLGNYIFVSDNFIKMIRILLNIHANIPVILMGETGVGKTKLLEVLIHLYDKGNCNWEELKIHAGITDKEIVSFIDKIIQKNEGKKTWVFLDEINTCNSLGLITEIMCNHTYLGKKIDDNFIFIGACNPYRKKSKKKLKGGLDYYNMKEQNKLNTLVYTVNPLPHSLLNFVIDFGALKVEDENKYIENNVISIFDNIKKNNLINDISDNDLENLRTEAINSIIICHDFIKEKYEKSSVSLREIRRFGIFFEFFIKYFKDIESCYKKIHHSLNLTLYLCYYIRLDDKGYRKDLSKKLEKYYKKGFISIPEKEIKYITNNMNIEKNKGIGLSRVLRENLFTIYICLLNKIPLIIIGKPGTSKSLSFQIIFNTMKGEYSMNKLFKDKGKLYRFYYQGSETSTSEGIEQIFDKAQKAQDQSEKENKNNINLVYFDEMGLAERSNNNPLKIMHFLLERDKEKYIPFLGMSNWKLDASKINRVLILAINDYDEDDLQQIAFSIGNNLNSHICNQVYIKKFFKALVKTYKKYIDFNQCKIDESRDFHGNRDFYHLIKNTMSLLIEKEKEISKKNHKDILFKIGIEALNRNFGGLKGSIKIIEDIFCKEYGYKSYNHQIKFKIEDLIKRNISDPNSRYLMLIADGDNGSDIIKNLLISMNKRYIELVGSKFINDIKSGKYSEEILNKVKYIMETDNILIFRDLNMIYASLYDLFNQNFTCLGDKKFARIAFEYAKISSEVNKNFHAIIIVNNSEIENLKLDPPFLNRFEKHLVDYKMLLDEKDIEIAKKIIDYIYLVATFNNNPKLKVDLKNLLINCKINDIEYLIYKIKNNNKDKKLINGPGYELNLREKVFKKIAPTFCQDIIASLLCSDLDREYSLMNKIIIDIYKDSRFYNFKSFINKIESNKHIIYTFSKIKENLFKDGENIENKKFGNFNKKTTTEIFDSIKAENELIYKLNTFFGSNSQKLLVLRFSEQNFNKINSVIHLIHNYERVNKNNKIIIFIIHRIRKLNSSKNKDNLLSFINDEYYQIFIDNLHGKENLNILEIISDKSQKLNQLFLRETNFIDEKVHLILSYMDFNLSFETKDFNKNNAANKLTEMIIENEDVKELLNKNMEIQSKSIEGIIKETFFSDNIEMNNVDFFEVICNNLNKYFFEYLKNIIFDSLKENILLPILNTKNYNSLMENEYFNDLIKKQFEKSEFNFTPPLKEKFESNKIKIKNGFNLPNCKYYLDKILNYTKKDICNKYIINEGMLRKKLEGNENIEKKRKKYNDILSKLEENIKNEIKKEEFLDAIYNSKNNNIAELLLKDYFNYFIINNLDKNVVAKNRYKKKLLSFFILIVKIMLNKDNHHNDFEYDIDEFSKIIIITQGYIGDIKIFLNKFIDFQIYSEFGLDIENKMSVILDENNIKYEISERNKEYTKDVNLKIFNFIESFIRSILLFSIELNELNKINKIKEVKFYEFISLFPSLKANLEQLNKKYFLFSKELNNLNLIIEIKKFHKSNINYFTDNYKQIMDNLLEQTIYLYNDDFGNFIQNTLNLVDLFNIPYKKDFNSLLNFIFFHQFKIISNNNEIDNKIELINKFLEKYPELLKTSKLFVFVFYTLKEMKPELLNEKKKDSEKLVEKFMNFDNNKKVKKYKNIYKIYDNNKIEVFNEILLYIFEIQCQSYFNLILKHNNNEYTEKCCKEILLGQSFSYFKKAFQFLTEHINNKDNYNDNYNDNDNNDDNNNDNKDNNNDNNLLKLYANAYIKTYCYYLVEINYEHFEKCNFEQINNLLNHENEKIISIRNMIIIYILRLFFKKFKNYDKLKNFDFAERKLGILNKIIKDKEKQGEYIYIFIESFIPKNNLDSYNKISIEIDKLINAKKINESIFNEINQNFDCFYCILVNKYLSFLYGNEDNKQKYIDNLKLIYELTNDKLDFEEEGKILYKYLMNYDLLEKNIFEKISQKKLEQEEFEILLYSFRFLLNIQMNKKKCFYNALLKKNIYQFIEENFIPGSFPTMNAFIKSYNFLVEEFKQKKSSGYYICKDCGYLYQVEDCTCPVKKGKCPNGHDIGGLNERCLKMDIKVFPDRQSLERGKKNDSFISKTLEEFKNEYVSQYINKIKKGIIKGYIKSEFERDEPVRNLNNIAYRLLNFILYSNLLGAFILNYLTNKEMREFLIQNLDPFTLFSVIKKDWSFLNNSLKTISIENVQIFINTIQYKIIELMNQLESVDTKDKLNSFEKKVNDYILEIISSIEDKKNLNEKYLEKNKEMLNINPQSFKEIIQANYEPSIYSQSDYPNIQFYTISNIYNLDTFKQKFNSSSKNREKYALTNIIINNSEILNNVAKLKNLKNINKLCNLLSLIYSYKISREDAQNKILKEEIKNILNYYNEMNNDKIKDENEFNEKYIKPFIESWDNIKYQSVQYGCQVLCDFEKGEKPLEMGIEKPLSYFLVNEGDKNGGLFLAAAYEYLVKCQNSFIDNILLNNQANIILNSYKTQLEQEIYIQDASDEEIININDKTYEKLEELIKESSMRNIYNENEDDINYRNYNDIIYDYDYIEDNLASEILLRIKKFKSKIKFVTFLYEGFRGDNSSILIDYMNKYIQRDLANEEKESLDQFLEENNNSEFYNDIFSSLQIFMKEIIKDNYSQNEIIYDIITKLSKYIKLNQELIQFLKKHKELGNKNSFTVKTLIPLFEYFEKLCWEDIKKNVLPDYKLEINEDIKNHILNYFNINEDKNVIDKRSFATALRKLISRYLSGLRQDTDIDSNINLMLYIIKEDLWDKDIINSEEFEKEINKILSIEIKIGQCFSLYNLIEEDEF